METRGCFISKKRQNTGVVHCRWRFACMATGITYCRVASDIPWTVKSCARCTRWTFARGEGKRRLPYLVGFRTDQSHAIHLGRLDKVERVHRLPSRIGLIARRRGTTKAGTPQYTYSNADDGAVSILKKKRKYKPRILVRTSVSVQKKRTEVFLCEHHTTLAQLQLKSSHVSRQSK